MKVFIVWYDGWNDEKVLCGVYSTEELAQAYINSMSNLNTRRRHFIEMEDVQ